MTAANDCMEASLVRELFNYEPESGLLKWKVRKAICVTVGQYAGNLTPLGYRSVKINGCCFQAHRLVWAYVHGAWPAGQIDHINGVGSDNRIENLRECTNGQNQQNRTAGKANKSGFLGVHWVASRKRWRSYITVNRKPIFLGTFREKDAANQAYLAAKKRLHTFNPELRGVA